MIDTNKDNEVELGGLDKVKDNNDNKSGLSKVDKVYYFS